RCNMAILRRTELMKLRAGRVDKLGRTNEPLASETGLGRERLDVRSDRGGVRSLVAVAATQVDPAHLPLALQSSRTLVPQKIPKQGSVSTCREHTGAGFGRLGRRGRLPLRGLHEERGLRFNFIVNTNAPLIASAAATTSSPPRNCPVELRTSPMMYGPKNPPRFPTELI